MDPRAGLDDVEKRKFLTLPGLELQPIQQYICGVFVFTRSPGSVSASFGLSVWSSAGLSSCVYLWTACPGILSELSRLQYERSTHTGL
jgi:hypothetical protein